MVRVDKDNNDIHKKGACKMFIPKTLNKYLLAGLLALGLTVTTTGVSQAHSRCGYWSHGHWYPTKCYRDHHHYRSHCRWVPGHYRHGHWVPGHRVCWR